MSATTSGDLAAISDGQIPNSPEIIDPNVRASIDTANKLFADSLADLPEDDDSEIEEPAATEEPEGQPRNPDGTFKAAEPEAPEDAPTEDAPAEEIAEVEPEVVTLLDRNGNERQIEVSDPEIAEILKAAKNDGLRRTEFNRRIESVQQKEQEFRAFEVMLQTTPESVVERMSPDVKMRTLNYLLANNFHEVKPILEQWYGDDTARREALLGMRETMTASQKEATSQLNESVRRQGIGTAIESLIPETASPEDAQDFFTAAAAHIAAVDAQRGYSLRPEEVAPLVDRFRARFGFTSPAPTEAAAPPSLVPVLKAAAAPVGTKAAEIAKRATATAQRMKALPAQQATAAKVARTSAGVQPAQPPRPKSLDEANANFLSILRGA